MTSLAVRIAERFLNPGTYRLRQRRIEMIRERNKRVGVLVKDYPEDDSDALVDEIARIEVEGS